MSLLQRITDRDPKGGIDLQKGQREKNPDETNEHVSLSPDESVPQPWAFTIAEIPFNNKPTPVNKSILIVEDEQIFAEDLKEILLSFGYHVIGIVSTGERAKATSPYGYILKPFDNKELHTAIEIAFFKHEKEEQLKKAYDELEKRVAEQIADLKRINEKLQESENRYRAVVEDQTEFICRFTPEGTLTFVNDAYCRCFGLKREECIGKRHSVVLPPDDLSLMKKHIRSLTLENPVGFIEHRIIMPSGEVRWQRWSDRAIFDKDGQVAEYQSVGRDITERKEAERTLLESETRLHAVVHGSPIPKFVIDKNHCIIYWNKALEEHSGIKAAEVVGTNQQWRAFYPHERPCMADLLVDGTIEKIPQWYEGKYSTSKFIEGAYEATDFFPKLGKTGAWLYFTATPIRDTEGDIIGAVEILEDITERKRAEEALLASDELFREVFNHANDVIFLHEMTPKGPPGKFILVNDLAIKSLGYTQEEFLRMSLGDIVPKTILEGLLPSNLPKMRKDGHATFESRIIRKDGSEYPVEVNAHTFPFKGRNVVLSIVRDITERKQAEETLRKSEERYRSLFEGVPMGLYRTTPSGQILDINPALVRLLGYPDRESLLAVSVSDLYMNPGDRNQWLTLIEREGIVRDFEVQFRKYDGTIIWVRDTGETVCNDSGQVIYYNGNVDDITERKQAEETLRENEKRIRDRTAELSATTLKLEKEIEDRIKIQKRLILSATEKDLLLREVHHRVKNNLQLIIGLIDMTKMRAHEPAVLSTLTAIMAKVQTMGLVHTQLYESKRVDKVRMKRQLQDLVDMISGFYDHERHDIITNINCPDIFLPVDLAIPCALAMNEIISNIHKHAFKGRRNGLVEISLSVKGDMLRIAIRDNGVGLPSGFNIEKSNRLGLKLMRTLVEQQLHGNVQITSKVGTEVVIEFPIKEGKPDYGTGTGS